MNTFFQQTAQVMIAKHINRLPLLKLAIEQYLTGSKQRQAIEVDEEGQVSGQTTPSKDSNACWIKKNGLYKLGYKQHTRTDG